MKSSDSALSTQIKAFCQTYLSCYQQTHQSLPLAEAVIDDNSPCIVSSYNDELAYWQPKEVTEQLSFSNVEQALELTLHPDIQTYFSQIYSDSIPATSEHGELWLLFAWGPDDFERLQQNLIGHVLMKRQLKQPVTLFFALTDEEDIIITLNNEDGSIWAERVGCQPHKKLADNMTTFLASIKALSKDHRDLA